MLRYENAFLALVVSPVYDIVMLALRNREPIGDQNLKPAYRKLLAQLKLFMSTQTSTLARANEVRGH